MDNGLAMGDFRQVENVVGRPRPSTQIEAPVRGPMDAPLGPRSLAPSGEMDPRPAQRMEGHAFG